MLILNPQIRHNAAQNNLNSPTPLAGVGLFCWEEIMTKKDKEAVIISFYNTAELAQKAIETGLDEWLCGTDIEAIDKVLLNVSELAIRLIRIGRY